MTTHPQKASPSAAQAAPATPEDSLAARAAEELVAAMSTEDKIHLVHGHVELSYTVPPLPEWGFPGLFMTDGPAGINLVSGSAGRSTAFPCPLALAATWNRELALAQGRAIAEEALQHGYNVVLAPNVDVVRQPWWGRAPEQFGEDPYLISEMAVPFVQGVQSRPVLANVKHLAVYTQETDRLAGANSVLDERTLREIYLPGFREAVTRGDARSVMSSFNWVNSTPTSEHAELIQRILKEEWGFSGWILSDYGSTNSTVPSANAGFDQEMPGGSASGGYGASECLFGAPLARAIAEGSVPPERLDDMVTRILRSMVAGGLMAAARGDDVPVPPVEGRLPPSTTAVDDTVALRVARESMTLLSNGSGLLPLKAETIRSIAVIGADAAHRTASGGASTVGNPIRSETLLDGLRARAAQEGIDVAYAPGCDPVGPTSMLPGPAEVPSSVLSPADASAPPLPPVASEAGAYGGRGTTGPLAENRERDGAGSADAVVPPDQHSCGLLAEYTDPNDRTWDRVRVRRTEPQVALSLGFLGQTMNASAVPGVPNVFPDGLKARWTGTLTPPVDGTYQLGVTSMGRVRVWLQGILVIDADEPHETRVDLGAPTILTGGTPYPIRIEFCTAPLGNFLELGELRLGWLTPADAVPPGIVAAAELAAESDVAVVLVHPYESEQRDRWSLQLPNQQDDLVRAVALANPRTVVVVASGGPILMPWLDDVGAVLAAYHAGQYQGSAIASVLFGDIDPSGRLPLTYPRSEAEVPVVHPLRSPTRPTILHDEGIFVGYRAYDSAQVDPLFPFGHGLSYTSFAYDNLEVERAEAGRVEASVLLRVGLTVRNTGLREGSDVVQLYISRPGSAVDRPLRELKAFAKVRLQPGGERRVAFDIRRQDLAHWDAGTSDWTVEPGPVEVLLGRSSRDIVLRTVIDAPSARLAEGAFQGLDPH